mgnify:CR=1 FL=1
MNSKRNERDKVNSQPPDLYEDTLRVEKIDPYESLIKKYLLKIDSII